MKFKVGDKVRCIHGSKANVSCGWEYGLEYVIKSIVMGYEQPCYFGGKDGGGVYEDFLELVNENKPTGNNIMSIISNTFKSKENKALEHFGLGSTCELNEKGKDEFITFLFETLKDERKAFLDKLVEAHKEATK